MTELTASEAAARLGVKKATLYAYVSRGFLHRRVALDGRTSVFDSAEIDGFRTSRRRVAEGELDAVISTAVTRVADGQLLVRGHDLISLVDDGARFEDVADLLWSPDSDGEPRPDTQVAREVRPWTLAPDLGAAVQRATAELPVATPAIERLRIGCAVASSFDPLRSDLTPSAVAGAGRRIVMAMIAALPPRSRSTAVRLDDSVAAALWPRLTEAPSSPVRVRVLDAALGLLADHGMASSTFAARIAASVRADPYSVVAAGLGVVGGVLHGAASAEVHRLIAESAGHMDPMPIVGDTRRRLGRYPGFGHSVYTDADPRMTALMARLDSGWQGDDRMDGVRRVLTLMSGHIDQPANIDLALGVFTWLADMGEDAGEAIFAIARTAGWLAHGLEEYEEAPLRFRPRARYVGPAPVEPSPGNR